MKKVTTRDIKRAYNALKKNKTPSGKSIGINRESLPMPHALIPKKLRGTMPKKIFLDEAIDTLEKIHEGVSKLEEPRETIICAAVKDATGQIFRGNRHADCFNAIASRGLKANVKAEAQGFITSLGRYVDRKEAREIQRAAGIPSADPKGYFSEVELYSEDLY